RKSPMVVRIPSDLRIAAVSGPMPRMSVIGYAIAASPAARGKLAAPKRRLHRAWPRADAFVCWFFHDRKSKMIPTAFSAASAIYCEIGDQPADEFVYCPNAIPALRQVSV